MVYNLFLAQVLPYLQAVKIESTKKVHFSKEVCTFKIELPVTLEHLVVKSHLMPRLKALMGMECEVQCHGTNFIMCHDRMRIDALYGKSLKVEFLCKGL